MKRIFSIFIVLSMIFCLSSCVRYEDEPTITEGEFPFVFEYEIDGKRFLIEDTVVCEYRGYDDTNPFPFTTHPRSWHEFLKSGEEEKRLLLELEDNSESVLVEGRINVESYVDFHYGFGGYYLGDPNCLNEGPCIRYVEYYKTSEKVTHRKPTELTNEQLEKYFGIKIIRFEFSNPIENKFE